MTGPAGTLRDRVAFDAPTMAPDGFGGQVRTWSEAHACAARFVFERGAEAVEAGGLTGSARVKVKVRACQALAGLSPAWRLRDLRRGRAFNIRAVDDMTQRGWVFLTIEHGVAL